MAWFILLLLGVSTRLFAEGNELLIFKPHPGSLQYNLSVKTHSELEVGSRSFGTDRGVAVDHEDIFVLSQVVKRVDGGLLDIALTVDELNLIPHGPSIGAQYKREQIIGNTQHISINLLGEVRAAQGFPHFASRNYYPDEDEGVDGVPLDMYRVMLIHLQGQESRSYSDREFHLNALSGAGCGHTKTSGKMGRRGSTRQVL